MGSDWNREVFDSVADFGTWNRCITRGLPEGMFPNPYNNGIQIVQSPGYVVINLEMIHEARIVPLGKMAPLESEIQQWQGSSRGHWDDCCGEREPYPSIGGRTPAQIRRETPRCSRPSAKRSAPVMQSAFFPKASATLEGGSSRSGRAPRGSRSPRRAKPRRLRSSPSD